MVTSRSSRTGSTGAGTLCKRRILAVDVGDAVASGDTTSATKTGAETRLRRWNRAEGTARRHDGRLGFGHRDGDLPAADGEGERWGGSD
ncbi:hypothetical protein E2562_019292 [Oryza meyeriana var. granulata]|uniref:Uncharacterized protein n=1 Tax=Oryza meyeriana var. granulata TaxID=110450 RepID=A0A6G1FA83_9ORYZ|nr:hypothetical protein E2562_019292 [Oryza meyeriana var. granulata]